MPSDCDIFVNAEEKNFSYSSLMTVCFPAAVSIPAARVRTEA